MDEAKQTEFDKILNELKSQFTADDLVLAILLAAGYEEKAMPFNLVELERLLYHNYDRLPSLARNHAYFKTSGTFPESPLIGRVYDRLRISGVFKPLNDMKLAEGTREFCSKEKAQPDVLEIEVIREIGRQLREKMTGVTKNG